jgi:hypothetical protein
LDKIVANFVATTLAAKKISIQRPLLGSEFLVFSSVVGPTDKLEY